MPNERVRFPPHADVPTIPDWWPRLFAVRQRRLRKRIIQYLTKHGRLGKSQIQTFCISNFDKQEIDHSLDVMDAEGIVTRENVVEGVGYRKLNVVTIAYYTLM